MSAARVLLAIHAAATLYMTGAIWFVQVVHYPLFNKVGLDQFARYEQEHARLAGYAVALPMIVELVTGVALFLFRPAKGDAIALGFGMALIVLIWVSTFFVQVPAHGMLRDGFDVDGWKMLVSTNWVRTVAWSARAVLVMWMLASRD